MICDPQAASVIFNAAFEAYSGIDRSLSEAASKLSAEELQKCKKAVGNVMGNILFELTEPILKDHPHLLPEEWKDSSEKIQA